MMVFLGMTGYGSDWIENYTLITTPLRNMIKVAGTEKLQEPLTWTEEGEQAFNAIQCLLQHWHYQIMINRFTCLFPIDFNMPQQFSRKPQVLEEKRNQ